MLDKQKVVLKTHLFITHLLHKCVFKTVLYIYYIYIYIYIIHILYYLQTDGTVQQPHMPCSYTDVALATFDNHAVTSNCSSTT